MSARPGALPAASPAAVAGTLPVRLLGTAAREALKPGRRGRVLACFRRSLYVELEGAAPGVPALACLGGASLGPGPLNALCDLPLAPDDPAAGLASGTRVRVQGATLCIGSRWRFALEGAEPWGPAALAGPDATRLAEGRALLAQACEGTPAPRGLARLLPSLLAAHPLDAASAPALPAAPGLEGALLRTAWEAARALQAWLAVGAALPSVPPGLAGLLGLGPGLTPAGDDLLGGALIALHALGRGRVADRLATTLLPLASHRTSRIGAAHLACAARGWGAGALHDALAALATAHGTALGAALGRLDAVGHSSGWDALAGAGATWAALAAGPLPRA
jgi:Protein of unknown function (DUF2877)